VKPVDIVVLIIVVCVCVVVVGPMFAFITTGERGSDEGSKLIAGLVASMIAIVSIYVGAKLRDKDDG
jgi:hypothetical protein